MKKFNREQLIFVVETMLSGAMDKVEDVLPHNNDRNFAVEMRLHYVSALESCGMSLGVLYAQLCDVDWEYDALAEAGNFDEQCHKLFNLAWIDNGVAVKKKQRELTSYRLSDLYTNYPNINFCATQFVNSLFYEYLKNPDETILRESRDLVEPGEENLNPEYCRALVNLTCRASGLSDDENESICKQIGFPLSILTSDTNQKLNRRNQELESELSSFKTKHISYFNEIEAIITDLRSNNKRFRESRENYEENKKRLSESYLEISQLKNKIKSLEGRHLVEIDPSKSIRILYTNWENKLAWRKIVPCKIIFDSTNYHPKKQWILEAFDLDKNAVRNFAILNIERIEN